MGSQRGTTSLIIHLQQTVKAVDEGVTGQTALRSVLAVVAAVPGVPSALVVVVLGVALVLLLLLLVVVVLVIVVLGRLGVGLMHSGLLLGVRLLVLLGLTTILLEVAAI